MRIPKTVSFTNPQLFQEIESYAKHRSIDFSQAVSELSEAGIALFKKTGSLNLDNLTMVSGLQADMDHLKGEVQKLWSILLGEAFKTGKGRDFRKPLRKIITGKEGSESK